MKTIVQIKQEIIESLRNFQSPIRITHSRATECMNEVMKEHPELLFYIQSYSGRQEMRWGSEPCVVYTIVYGNTDIPIDRIYKVDNCADVEHKLHSTIEHYHLSCGLCITSSVDINKIYNDFMIAYRGFYSNLLQINYQSMFFPGTGIQFAIFRFQYRIGRVKLSMMEREVDEEVARLGRKLFTVEMGKEAKAYVAHNYLAKSVEYWLKEEANPLEKSYMQSAYGALINHRCVCQGYAEAYKRLLDSQGIICDVICGKIRGSEEYHAWNVVSFDGKEYFHVDVTWDSRGKGSVGWDYFCKSDGELRSTRIWTKRSGIVCASSKNILAVARAQIAGARAKLLAKGIDKEYL